MILHLVKCEMCENQYQFDSPWQKAHERNAPDSWLTLFQSKDMPGQEGWHFCSKACLQRWAAPCDHAPYPFCCPKHYPGPSSRESK